MSCQSGLLAPKGTSPPSNAWGTSAGKRAVEFGTGGDMFEHVVKKGGLRESEAR